MLSTSTLLGRFYVSTPQVAFARLPFLVALIIKPASQLNPQAVLFWTSILCLLSFSSLFFPRPVKP